MEPRTAPTNQPTNQPTNHLWLLLCGGGGGLARGIVTTCWRRSKPCVVINRLKIHRQPRQPCSYYYYLYGDVWLDGWLWCAFRCRIKVVEGAKKVNAPTTHSLTDSLTHSLTHSLSHTYTHIHIHTHSLTLIHTYTHTHSPHSLSRVRAPRHTC